MKKVGARWSRAEHGGVDGSVEQPVDLVCEAHLADHEFDVGVGDGKRGDERLSEPHPSEKAEHELVCLGPRAPSSGADGRIAGHERGARVFEEHVSCRCGSDSARVTVKQRGPDLAFESENALGERWLGDARACRRARKLPGLSDGDRIAEVAKLDRHMLNLYQVVSLVFDG
jgi:hypothetical protein